jgi:hypothetical protein
MSQITSDRTFTTKAKLSSRYSVEMTLGHGGFVCEWEPATPRSLTKAELAIYRTVRNNLLRTAAIELDQRIAIVETF